MQYPVNALNPKVSTLIKLGLLLRRVLHLYAGDEELMAWYDRMAELDYVPPRKPTDKAQRYQIYATQKVKGGMASYTEATSADAAMQRCLDQFPVREGWYAHYVKNLDTGMITEAASVILFQEGETVALRMLDGPVDRIEAGAVITHLPVTQTFVNDAGPKSMFIEREVAALSLDEDDEPAALSLED
jgi:hypothetical protein